MPLTLINNRDMKQLTDDDRFQLRKGLGMFLGVKVTPPNDKGIAHVEQVRLTSGVLLNQKQLVDSGRTVYPEKEYIVSPHVYKLDTEEINPEWVRNRMEEFGLKRGDLIRQLDIDASSLSQILTGKRGMTKAVKALFFYYFNTYRLTKAIRDAEE